MIRCPLCGESYNEGEPHICKCIHDLPAPFKFCKECGTMLGRNNADPNKPYLCRDCATSGAGGIRHTAIDILLRKGKLLLVKTGDKYYPRIIVVSSEIGVMDMMARIFGGTYRRHEPAWRWELNRGSQILNMAFTIHRRCPEIGRILFSWHAKEQGRERYQYILDKRHEYGRAALALSDFCVPPLEDQIVKL